MTTRWITPSLILALCYWSPAFAQSVRVADASLKVRPTDNVTAFSGNANISAARNEFEAFQLVVPGPAAAVSVTPPRLFGPSGVPFPADAVRLYRVDYINTQRPSNLEGLPTGRWPYQLRPHAEPFGETRNAFPFDVPSGENRLVWVEILVPERQPAGIYTGIVVVNIGGTAHQVPITLTVRNFALPSTSSLASTFGLSWDGACAAHFGSYENCGRAGPGEKGDLGVRYDDALEYLRTQYARFCLDHRITCDAVYNGPTPPLSSGAWDWTRFDQRYGPLFDGTDSRVRLPGARQTTIRYTWSKGHSAERYKAWADHFRAKNWLSRSYVQTCDEPPRMCQWDAINDAAGVVRAGARDLRTMVTTNISLANANQVTSAIDIIAPVANHLDDKNGEFAGNQRPTYDQFLKGPYRLLWLYQSCMSHHCTDVGDDYWTGWPNVMADASGVQNRAQGILSWVYQVSGMLYFQADKRLASSWTDIFNEGGNGDGTLLSFGKPCTDNRPECVGGSTHIPVATIPLKMIREGIEDYEYLNLLAVCGDPQLAHALAREVFPNMYSTAQPISRVHSLRERASARIVQLQCPKPPTNIRIVVP